jgi:hypothetical protein
MALAVEIAVGKASHPSRGADLLCACNQGWLAMLAHPWLLSDHAYRRGRRQPGRTGRK